MLARIRKGDLADGFTARDIQRNQWSGLTDNEAIKAGLELLASLDWINSTDKATGGRPSIVYAVNPRALQ